MNGLVEPPPVTRPGNLLETIRARMDVLRRSERKVAQVVLSDPESVVRMTLAEMALAASVSEPTVIRFCEAIGCPGFQPLKLELARSSAFGVSPTHSVIAPQDSPQRITDKIFEYTLTSLDHARRRLDPTPVAHAIDLLAAATRIEFMGFGASGIVALDAQQKFPLFGCPCGASTDHHQQYMLATTMEPGDVLVAISNRGETQTLLQVVQVARTRGVIVIALTGRAGPLAEAADLALIVETLDNTNVFTPTISRIAALVMVDVLSTGVALRMSSAQTDRLVQMKRALARMRTGQNPPSGDCAAPEAMPQS
jgi:RpiR family transcriptional regulator, carbohydrate utilization regulator